MRVKLLTDRTRGEDVFVVGDEYECSDAEGKSLVTDGFAVAVKEPKVEEPKVEAAAVKAPEKAVAAKPQTR